MSCVFCATFERHDSAKDDNRRRAPRQLLSGPLRRARNRSLAPFTLRQRQRQRRETSIDRSTPTSAAARRLRGLASALLPDYNSPSRTEKQTSKQTEKHSETKHIPAPTRVFFFFFAPRIDSSESSAREVHGGAQR